MKDDGKRSMGDVIKLKCYLIKLIEQVKYKIKRSKWGRGEYKKKLMILG